MIAAGMIYALAVGLLLSFAALAAESFLALRHWPRRYIWIATLVASLAVPGFVLIETADTPAVTIGSEASQVLPFPAAHGALSANVSVSPWASVLKPPFWPQWPQLDSALLGLWALGSLVLLGLTMGGSDQPCSAS